MSLEISPFLLPYQPVLRQYQVSSAAVIRRPWNLLEWCSRYRITSTFSPNFLIAQILSQDSSRVITSSTCSHLDLSALRCFVTGGESNPVRTGVEFADLLERYGSPRTTLRAAFGMTETGVIDALLFLCLFLMTHETCFFLGRRNL